MKDKIILVDQMQDGNYQLVETGVILNPNEFDKLQKLEENVCWIVIVNSVRQLARTNARHIDFNLAK